MKPIITVENISYQVENKKILKNINLSINSGDSFALIGKNGSGKTTLFDIILNDIKPTSGVVKFDNEIGNNLKNTGVVYDYLPFFPLLKVKEIIDYFSSLYRINSKDIPIKYYEVFGLTNVLNSYIKDLSQGERKKVGLFLSILHNPKLLILDEPFSTVDTTVIDSIWQVLRENNRTILFTTHNWKDLENVSTKIAFINKGEIVLQPTSAEEIIKALPHQNKIVAENNDNLVESIKGFDFYINENLLHIFNDGNSKLVDIVSGQTNNYSFRECDIKDAYLFKIKDNE